MGHQNEHSSSDRLTVERILGKDFRAFEQVINGTKPLVAQIIFKLVKNEEDRKDLVQDVYLKTYHNLKHFRFQCRLSTWIAQIAYNTCINYLRKKKLVLVCRDDADAEEGNDLLEKLAHQRLGSENSTELYVSNKELVHMLRLQMEQLPPLYHMLITLFHREELSYAEIAQITNLPEGTIKSYLFRARKMLKENLQSHYKKEWP